MKSITELREINLLELLKNYRRKEDFSEATGIPANYMHRWYTTGQGKRNMSEDYARLIEHKLGLKPGYMDMDHTQSKMDELNVSNTFVRSIKMLEEIPDPLRGIIQQLITATYKQCNSK